METRIHQSLLAGPFLKTDPLSSGLEEECAAYMDPYMLSFTHARISKQFRNGLLIDHAIETALNGGFSPHAFPSLEVVLRDGKCYVIRGNRRLFMFRVLASFNVASKVRVQVVEWASQQVQGVKWDVCLGRFASKWDRALSTRNGGHWVMVHSKYLHHQVRPADIEAHIEMEAFGKKRARSSSLSRVTSSESIGTRRASSAGPTSPESTSQVVSQNDSPISEKTVSATDAAPMPASLPSIHEGKRETEPSCDPKVLNGVTGWLGVMARNAATALGRKCQVDEAPLELLETYTLQELWDVFMRTASTSVVEFLTVQATTCSTKMGNSSRLEYKPEDAEDTGAPAQFIEIIRRYSVSRWLWPRLKDKRQMLLWDLLHAGALALGEREGSFPERNQGNERAVWRLVDLYLSDVREGSWRWESRGSIFIIFYERFFKNVACRRLVLGFVRQHCRDPSVKERKGRQGVEEILGWAREIQSADATRREWLFSKILSKLAGQWTRKWPELDDATKHQLRNLLGPGAGLTPKQEMKLNSIISS